MEVSQSALELIAQLPPPEVGCLYLSASSQPACPEPSRPDFPKLTHHFGSVRGAWPRIAAT